MPDTEGIVAQVCGVLDIVKVPAFIAVLVPVKDS
jgi:hypothetical protein